MYILNRCKYIYIINICKEIIFLYMLLNVKICIIKVMNKREELYLK